MTLSDNLKGALLMSGAMAAFTVNDTFMKTLADDMSLVQAIFMRGAIVTGLLGTIAILARIPLSLTRPDRRMVLLRTVGEVAAAFLFITAIFNAPLANMTAILQALPLTVTLAGWAFLGEPVGWRRLVAILIGLLGVLLIVRPGMAGFDHYSIFALGAVAAVTLRDLATRRLSPATSSLAVALTGSVAVTAASGLGVLATGWTPLDADMAIGLGGTSTFIMVAYLLSVMVMRVGDIGFVSPFRYTGLLWALLLGWLVFAEWPDTLTLAGASLIISTGAFTLWRERRASRHAILTQARPARLG